MSAKYLIHPSVNNPGLTIGVIAVNRRYNAYDTFFFLRKGTELVTLLSPDVVASSPRAYDLRGMVRSPQ